MGGCCVGGVLGDSGEVLGGISPIKKAKEPPIDEHLTLLLHGKGILTTPSAGKSPLFGLLSKRVGALSGKTSPIALSVDATGSRAKPNLTLQRQRRSRELPQ